MNCALKCDYDFGYTFIKKKKKKNLAIFSLFTSIKTYKSFILNQPLDGSFINS